MGWDLWSCHSSDTEAYVAVLTAKKGPAADAYQLHPVVHADVSVLNFLVKDMWELKLPMGMNDSEEERILM